MAKSKIESFIENNPLTIIVVAAAGTGVYFIDEISNAFFGTGNKTLNPNNGGAAPNTSNLPKPGQVYQSAADNIFSELNDSPFPKSSNVLDMLKDMNDDELKQIYNLFGQRKPVGEPTEGNHDLIWFFMNEHGFNPFFSTDDIKARFATTGLWP